MSFRSAWNSATAYAIGDAASEGGTSYVALIANTNTDPATDVANSGGNWAVLASKGAAGAAGSQGLQGIQGIQGTAGTNGTNGSNGANGAAATIAAGTTTTGAAGSSASVTNSGTNSAAVVNFTIPRGDVGAAGATGPAGPTGATGAAGTVTGISAGTVTNSGSTGTLTIGGTAAVPAINVNFPASSGGGTPTIAPWQLGTVYTSGQLVSDNGGVYYALAGSTGATSNEPGSGTATANTDWTGVALGSGTSPAGIPYTVSNHQILTGTACTSPAGSTTTACSVGGTVNDLTSLTIPSACTPSLTIYSYGATGGVFSLNSLTPSNTSYLWTVGSTVAGMTCNAVAYSGTGNATPCPVTGTGQLAAGSVVTLFTPAQTSISGFSVAFSCH